jgi:hypothetical protein
MFDACGSRVLAETSADLGIRTEKMLDIDGLEAELLYFM